MAKLSLLLLICCPSFLTAQQQSPSYKNEVDSLMRVSNQFISTNNIKKSLEAISSAEQLMRGRIEMDSTAYANVCLQYGRVHYINDDFKTAEIWYLKANDIYTKMANNKSLNTIICLNGLGILNTAKKKYTEAEQYLLKSKDLCENTNIDKQLYPKILFDLGLLYVEIGDYVKAENFLSASKDIRFKILGNQHLDYESSVYSLAKFYANKGEYAKAEKLYLEGKEICEKNRGKESLEYSWSLNKLATVYADMGKLKEAEDSYLKENAIKAKISGKETIDYANSLTNLANLYRIINQNEKSETNYREALSIFDKIIGKESPEYAKCLVGLARNELSIGNYEKAEPMFNEAKTVQEKTVGKYHQDYALTMSGLGSLHLELGNFQQSEQYYKNAISVQEKIYGSSHPILSTSLNNLGNLYTSIGDFNLAEHEYIRAKDITLKTLGKSHPDYASNLNNLAVLYDKMGNYATAEKYYLEAKDITEIILGKEHPEYAMRIDNLANLYQELGNYEKAEPLKIEAANIREKTRGKINPEYALSLNSLAAISYSKGQFDKAETQYLEAKAIQIATIGKNHPDYATTINNLAIVTRTMAKYDQVEPLLLEAKAIREKVLGKDHPDYAKSLATLSSFYESQNRYQDSEDLQQELSMLEKKRLSKAAAFLSERELAGYSAIFQKNKDDLGSFVLTRKLKNIQSGALSELMYNHALFYKGFLLFAISRLNNLSNSSNESIEITKRLKAYRLSIIKELGKPLAKQNNVSELEEKANIEEKALVKSVAEYAKEIKQIEWKEIQNTLKDDEAALEFVHFKLDYPKTTDSIMYAALIIKKGSPSPAFIPLFEQKTLDSIVNINQKFTSDYVNNMYSQKRRGAEEVTEYKKTLYEVIWKPLEQELKDIKTIYFSPTGSMHRINLDAIPVSNSTSLADRYKMVQIKSTRQLVVPITYKIVNDNATVYGGIQYGANPKNNKNSLLVTNDSLSLNSLRSSPQSGPWNYLDGTEKEAITVDKILKTSGTKTALKMGFDASEDSFKIIGIHNSSSPKILHLATHGYFSPDPKTSLKKLDNENESIFKISDNPMLRSGLIMAGGNLGWQGDQAPESVEDGILTASEISQMNLSNTELVVLSACETGLGDIQGNEGVYGLQRAFKIAGAGYLIMSLWQVPDKQTPILMTSFYKKWLETEGPDGIGKMTIPEAFHAAQQEMREIGLDPHQWAGFVLVE